MKPSLTLISYVQQDRSLTNCGAMMHTFSRKFLTRIQFSLFVAITALAGVVLVGLAMPTHVNAQAVGKGITNLELPRFVSLKARRANMRVGPGKTYSVSWQYLKPGIPLEVVQEFDYWRRVRDSEGTEGWLYHSLLSGKRTVIVAPWDKEQDGAEIQGYSKPSKDSRLVVRFAPGVFASVDICDGKWCRLTHSKGEGWVEQKMLWGVYPDEKLGS